MSSHHEGGAATTRRGVRSGSRSTTPAPKTSTPPPTIGALLRYAWQGVRAQILEGLQAAGFTDLRAPHLDVFQHPGPEGARPGDLAARARMTKQAMNQLLRSLEEFGYVGRRSPSDGSLDGRARVVHLTPRGVRATATIRAVLIEIEAAWTARLGGSRFADLKATLEQMRELSPDDAADVDRD